MKKILLLILSICVGFKVSSQWQQIESPKGIKINDLYSTNEDFYACASKGIYEYNSDNWNKLGDDFNLNVSSLILSGDYLFAGTTSDGVYRSSDSGSTWLEINNNLTSIDINEIQLYNNTLFAGTINGLFMSDNNGVQWTDMSGDFSNKNITSILTFNDSLFVGTQNGIYLSSDTAKTWTLKSSGLTSKNISKIISVDSRLIAATNGGIFVSDDTAKTWVDVNSGLTNLDVNVLYYNGDTLFAGTTDSLFFTTDLSTISWESLAMNLPSEEVITLSEINGSLIVGNSFGAFKKTKEFVSMNDGLPEWSKSKLFAYDSILFLKTNMGIWELNKLNNEWDYCKYFPNNSVSEIMDYNDTTVLVYNNTGIYKSHDTLKTWTRISDNTKITSIDTLAPYIFFGTSDAGVFRSNNMGMDWLQVNIGLVEKDIIDIICTKEKIFVATDKSDYGSKIYASTNNGDEWYQISDLVDRSAVVSNCISLDTAILLQTERMYYSINVSSELMDTIKPEYINDKIYFEIQKTIKTGDAIISGSGSSPKLGVGIYISMKNCQNFAQINKGLPSYISEYSPYRAIYLPVNDLVSSDLCLYILVSTDNILMKRNWDNIIIPKTPTNLTMDKDTIDYGHYRLNFKWQNNSTAATEMILTETDNPHGGVSVGDLNFIKKIDSAYDTTSLLLEESSNDYWELYRASNYQIIACDNGDCSIASEPAKDTAYSSFSGYEDLVSDNMKIKVFPNPVTNGYININVIDGVEYDIIIFNSLGEIIFSKSIWDDEDIHFKNQPRGIYMLVARNKATSLSKTTKIIVL